MGIQRLLLAIAVVLIGGGGVVAGVGVDDDPERGSILAPPVPKVRLSFHPGPGATLIGPTESVSVTATDGSLRDITLTSAGGKSVRGEYSPDRRTWTVAEPLEYGATYTWRGTATDIEGLPVPVAGGFGTLKPVRQVRATLNIADGRTVGIAAPIQLQFNGHVANRAAVERALTVRTSVPTEGSWGWLQDELGGSRLHWRPKEYWKAGTQVSVSAKLFGVDYGAGLYGATDVSTSFTIGRAQLVKADVNSHEMVVVRDGAEVARYPASYGLDSDPDRNTRSGIHVITEKFTDKRMVSEQYDYDVVEKWAVRMSNNGEFIHANPGTTGVQGSSNVSHGCVNLSTENAREFYNSAIYGDPVEVTGSGVKLSARDGDIWVWTIPWPQWRALSALEATG